MILHDMIWYEQNKIKSYHIISYHVISYKYHIMSYHITSYQIVSYHIISYHIISYHIISNRIISYHIISCHITLNHIISYHIISYDIKSNQIGRYHILFRLDSDSIISHLFHSISLLILLIITSEFISKFSFPLFFSDSLHPTGQTYTQRCVRASTRGYVRSLF